MNRMDFDTLACKFIDTCAEAKSQTGNGKVQYVFSIFSNDNIMIKLNDKNKSTFVFSLEDAKKFVARSEYAIQYSDNMKFIEFIRLICYMMRMKIDEIEG